MQVLLSIGSDFSAASMSPIMLFLELLQAARFDGHAEHELCIQCYRSNSVIYLQLEWTRVEWLSTAAHALFPGNRMYANRGLMARVQVREPLKIDFTPEYARALSESYILDREGLAKLVQAIGGVFPS